MIRVTGRKHGTHFCAGVIRRGHLIVKTAPILRRWLLGKTHVELVAICRTMDWHWEEVDDRRRSC